MVNKKVWIENRVNELTEQRRNQLEEVYEEEWLFRVGVEEEERVSLEYSEEIIPDAIEKLKYEDGWDEAYTSALEEINFNYSIWNLQKKWDEIEEKFPRYIEEIKSFLRHLSMNTMSWKMLSVSTSTALLSVILRSKRTRSRSRRRMNILCMSHIMSSSKDCWMKKLARREVMQIE